MKNKMNKLESLEVRICKREESSGNEQFFVQLVRTDEKSHGAILDYDCFQTKHLDKKTCLEHAWFSASMLARFCGLSSMNEILLYCLNEQEKEIITKALYLKW